VLCTVKQQGVDYGFEFIPTISGVHYLTVTSDTKDDAMCAPDYLAIYPKHRLNASVNDEDNSRLLFTSVGQSLEVPVTTIGFANGFSVSSDNDKFEVQTPTLPSTGGTITVRFIGNLTGEYTGNLTITSTNPAAPAPGLRKVTGSGTLLTIPMVASITTGINNIYTDKVNTFIVDNNIVAEFNLLKTSDVGMSVYNVNGMLIKKELLSLNAGKNKLTVNVNIPSGVYFVKMSIDGKTITNKIVK